MKKGKKIKSLAFYVILSLIIILISTIFSFLIILNVLYSCSNEIRSSYLLEFLCDNVEKTEIKKEDEFVWIKPEDILRVYSNDILEKNEDSKADKLIDGDINTGAYPGNKEFDYIIEFLDEYEISRVEIIWGGSGTGEKHIQKWSLESKSGLLGEWQIVAGEEQSPRSENTVLNINMKADSIKIRASSQDNWIGILEVKVLRKS